jgi:hypothetical protein
VGTTTTIPPPTTPAPTPAGQGGPTPYIRRRIDLKFQLGNEVVLVGGRPVATGKPATFANGANTLTLTGHRCSVTISHAAAGAKTTCSVRVYGMAFKDMIALTTRGLQYPAVLNHTIEINAGDDLAGMTRIFQGVLVNCYFDGESQPDAALMVEAFVGAYDEMKPAVPISVAGGVDVATIMKQLAERMKLTFENHGVVAKLRDIYYPGTAMQQARRIAEHAGINFTVENGVLAIWPRGRGREVGDIPLISPDSGMKNYPIFDSRGIMVTTLFRPLKLGIKIVVQSHLWNMEKKLFYIYGYSYSLESESSGGPWHATFGASGNPIIPIATS